MPRSEEMGKSEWNLIRADEPGPLALLSRLEREEVRRLRPFLPCPLRWTDGTGGKKKGIMETTIMLIAQVNKCS
jgi:hypothetical protein